jgi:uncharacterized protein YqgV (UPF0045/DUF77 family)
VHEYVAEVMYRIESEGVGWVTPAVERSIEVDVEGMRRALERGVEEIEDEDEDEGSQDETVCGGHGGREQ